RHSYRQPCACRPGALRCVKPPDGRWHQCGVAPLTLAQRDGWCGSGASACSVSFHEPGGCQFPRQTGGVLRTAGYPPPVWRGTVRRAQHLAGPNHPHTGVVAIRNVDIPLRVYVTSMLTVQSRSKPLPTVAGTAPASASDGRDHSSHRVNMTYRVVLGVHDQQVAVVVTPDGLRGSPGSGESWTTLTTVATCASTSVD